MTSKTRLNKPNEMDRKRYKKVIWEKQKIKELNGQPLHYLN